MISHVSIVMALLAVYLVAVNGQTGVAECYYNAGGGPFIRVTATNAVGLTVYVIGCTDTNPVATDPETVDTSCPITPGTNASIYLSTDAILTTDDVQLSVLSCELVTGTQTVTNGITVNTPTATATINSELVPTIATKITSSDMDQDGTALTTAYVGQPVCMWFWIVEEDYRSGANGFDLSAFDVILGGSPDMVLTGSDGCIAASPTSLWGDLVKVAQGIYKICWSAFYRLGTTGTIDSQNFNGTIQVCTGATQCNPVCVTRKRRDASDMENDNVETVGLSGALTIVPYEGYQEPSEVDVTIKDEQVEPAQECEECMQKSVMYGVTSLLVALLILSMAVSCYLFMRTKRSRKLLSYDGEMKGSSNPGYNH